MKEKDIANHKWNKLNIDSEEMENQFSHVKKADKCFYLMEYTIGGSYEESRVNSLIFNFKMKHPYLEDRIQHRTRAIKIFSKDLSEAVSKILNKYSEKRINISFIPTSKLETDENYSNRFEKVCAQLKRKKIQNQSLSDLVSFHQPIKLKEARKKASQSKERRDDKYVKNFKSKFSWEEFPNKEPEVLIIFDDVIRTGSQYRAFKEFSLEKMKAEPQEIIALFWAKAIEKIEDSI